MAKIRSESLPSLLLSSYSLYMNLATESETSYRTIHTVTMGILNCALWTYRVPQRVLKESCRI